MHTAGLVSATAVKEMRAGILLITSNIGSLFGEKQGIRKYWLDQISNEVAHFRPSFLALHVQESGGKNYKQHSREMPGLVEELHRRLLKSGYIVSHCFLDIQHEVVEEFTALSSLFFVHESAADHVWQYNFRQRKFIPVFDGQQQQEEGGGIAACKQLILTSGLVRSGYVKKEKFSRDFWPTFRFGRKGFLYTRWKIANNTFDLINVHLFHDESNLNFLENPMQYCNNRRNALNYVLHKFEKFNGGTIEGSSNLFIFGDFNFRLNLAKLVKKLTMQTSECREVLLNSSSGSRARGGVVHSAPSVSDSSVGGEDLESSEDSALSSSLSQPSRSPTAEPSASSSETDELRTSCDDFDDGIAEDLAASMTRRKNSIIEYYKPLVREYLSPFDGTAGNVSWVLRIGRKRFEYHDPGWLLRDWKSYKEDDHEPSAFPLNELEPNFPPTYPWSEESSCHQLMTTRAPAWCDRILFNENARRELIYRRQPSLSNGPQQQQQQQHVYRSFGMDDCIGDHKPVLLYFTLPSSSA